jgi:hypothetical protein
VRGDAFFAHLVHFFGADLDFKSLARLGDDGGVQRLVEIGPRHGDEVLDTAGHGAPEVVDDAENGVAILHGISDDAHGIEVVDLLDADALALQFLVDAVEALDAAFDAAGDAGFFQAVAEHALDARHEGFALFAAGLDGDADLLVSDGIDVLEPEVFQFAANFAHAEAVRDGSVDVERLAGDFLLALGIEMLEGAHVVQAVGELDETTRMSSTMASIILRRFSACASSLEEKSILLILVTPSTMWATCSPNSWRISTVVTEVSSTESCRRPAAMETESIFMSARTLPTSSG